MSREKKRSSHKLATLWIGVQDSAPGRHVLPRLPLYAKFVVELQRCGFEGDCLVGYGERLALSTDNSIYQRLPQAIVFRRRGDPAQGGESIRRRLTHSSHPAVTKWWIGSRLSRAKGTKLLNQPLLPRHRAAPPGCTGCFSGGRRGVVNRCSNMSVFTSAARLIGDMWSA